MQIFDSLKSMRIDHMFEVGAIVWVNFMINVYHGTAKNYSSKLYDSNIYIFGMLTITLATHSSNHISISAKVNFFYRPVETIRFANLFLSSFHLFLIDYSVYGMHVVSY